MARHRFRALTRWLRITPPPWAAEVDLRPDSFPGVSPVVVAGGEGGVERTRAPARPAAEERLERFDPVGNERLTAVVGIVLLVLTVVELATILLVCIGSCRCTFVGFVLIPPMC